MNIYIKSWLIIWRWFWKWADYYLLLSISYPGCSSCIMKLQLIYRFLNSRANTLFIHNLSINYQIKTYQIVNKKSVKFEENLRKILDNLLNKIIDKLCSKISNKLCLTIPFFLPIIYFFFRDWEIIILV